MCACVRASVHVCMYVQCMCVCMYMCMHVYISSPISNNFFKLVVFVHTIQVVSYLR